VTYTPAVNIVASPQGSVCAGTTVIFTAAAVNTSNGIVNYNFKINGTLVQTGPSNIYTSSTLRNGNTITCDITINGGNCLTAVQASSNTITMQVIRPAHINLGDDAKICVGDYIILRAPDSFTNYLWNTGDTSKFITVTQPSIYWLRIRDQNGCFSSDTISVVENHICGTFIPSGFTPNNDGLNDVFKPVITGNLISYKFSIYNRWGQKIFESTDLQKGWDGSLKHEPLKTDVFVWMCEYQLAGKPVVQKRGTVTLIR
jgi:gliding motility-associated-like protein